MSNGTDQAFYIAVVCANALSATCALLALTTYFLLRRTHSLAMRRVTLKISACMAGVDLVMHLIAPFGYGVLPSGFTCGFIGGFAFAFPVLISLLYACTIAMNCQVVFVLGKHPKESLQRFYPWIAPIIALSICLPTLVAGIYGYDEVYAYCWYASDGTSQGVLRVRRLMTYSLWCILGLGYLVISTISITHSLFFKNKSSLQIQSPINPDDPSANTLDTQDRRQAARRALLVRLLGYIIVPGFCIVPGAIEDLVATLGYPPSSVLSGIISVISSLLGTFNAILFFIDPTVLSMFAFMRKNRQRKTARRAPILAAPMPLSDYELTLRRMETNPSSTKTPIMIAIEITTETSTDAVDCIVDDLKGL